MGAQDRCSKLEPWGTHVGGTRGERGRDWIQAECTFVIFFILLKKKFIKQIVSM